MDLVFCGEFRLHDCWRRSDWLRQVSGLSERAILHVRTQVGPRAVGRILSLGVASVFVRCCSGALFAIVQVMTRLKLGRHKERKEEWLAAFPGMKNYLNQCVVCQDIGYDPIRIKKKQGRFFQKRLREFFHPLPVDSTGICAACVSRRSVHE